MLDSVEHGAPLEQYSYARSSRYTFLVIPQSYPCNLDWYGNGPVQSALNTSLSSGSDEVWGLGDELLR